MGRLSALPSATPVKSVMLRSESQQLAQESTVLHPHNNSYHLLKAFYVPSTTLSLLHTSLKPTNKLIEQVYYHYFTDDKK